MQPIAAGRAAPIHSQSRSDERGMATVEALPILIVFVVVCSYAVGSFGAIHTAILHSIAARVYAYETFRHRTDLVWFRDNAYAAPNFFHLKQIGARVHGVGSPENAEVKDRFYATERPLAKGLTSGPDEQGRDPATHNDRVLNLGDGPNATLGVSPIWIMTQYGICLNAECQGQR